MKKILDKVCCVALACVLVFAIGAFAIAAEKKNKLFDKTLQTVTKEKAARQSWNQMKKKCHIPTMSIETSDGEQEVEISGIRADNDGSILAYYYDNGNFLLSKKRRQIKSCDSKDWVERCERTSTSPEIKDKHIVCYLGRGTGNNYEAAVCPQDGRMWVYRGRHNFKREVVDRIIKIKRIPKESEFTELGECGKAAAWGATRQDKSEWLDGVVKF